MIVVPVLIALALGFAVRPARWAQLAIGLLMSVFALTVWFVVAHDDGETRTFVCSVAGLWALVAAGGVGGSFLASRRNR